MNNVERIFDQLLHLSDKEVWEYLKSLKQSKIRTINGYLNHLKGMLDKNLENRYGKWDVPAPIETNNDEMVSVQEAAKELNYSVKSLYGWIHAEKIIAVKIGKYNRISRSEIRRIKAEGLLKK